MLFVNFTCKFFVCLFLLFRLLVVFILYKENIIRTRKREKDERERERKKTTKKNSQHTHIQCKRRKKKEKEKPQLIFATGMDCVRSSSLMFFLVYIYV